MYDAASFLSDLHVIDALCDFETTKNMGLYYYSHSRLQHDNFAKEPIRIRFTGLFTADYVRSD